MAKIQVHAGDFLKVDGQFSLGSLTLRTAKHSWVGETIKSSEIEEIALASEENLKKITGTVGWGLTGGVLLGPAGLLAGLLLGGRKKEVTFVAKFKDGRKLLATTDPKTYKKLLAAAF